MCTFPTDIPRMRAIDARDSSCSVRFLLHHILPPLLPSPCRKTTGTHANAADR